jgi:Alpha/beta hydrolase of unknown function (DUF900)
MNVTIQDFVVLRSIIRSEVSPTLLRFTSVLTILCLFMIIFNPFTMALSVMAQPLTLTTTDTSYHIDDVVSTRGHFDYLTTGELTSGHDRTDYEYYNNDSSSGIESEIICPPQKEIAIYIHGIWTNEATANEQFDRTAKSLAANNYSIPLIGFSWDSNTPFNKNGWEIAKNIAKDNGLKLAQFIFDLKNKCKDTDIRLIAHSLGAAVVNSTLITISNNRTLNNNVNNSNGNFNIKSVHLLGAAMDRNVAASNTTFGKAIEDIVDNFYNLRNPEDNMLEYVYRYVENHDAIGLLGIQHSLPLPSGYSERQVDSEILPIPDADANAKFDCFDSFVLLPGDNHCGYIGFRNLHPFGNMLRDDGAIDMVVRNWSE